MRSRWHDKVESSQPAFSIDRSGISIGVLFRDSGAHGAIISNGHRVIFGRSSAYRPVPVGAIYVDAILLLLQNDFQVAPT